MKEPTAPCARQRLLALLRTQHSPDTVPLAAAREEVRVHYRDGEREEILRRLNAHEETFGETRARSTDPAEEERWRKLQEDLDYEQGFFPVHGLLGRVSWS